MELFALCFCFMIYGWAIRGSLYHHRRKRRSHRRMMKVIYLYH